MSTADLAIIALLASNLALIGTGLWVTLRVVHRLQIAKAPNPPAVRAAPVVTPAGADVPALAAATP